MNAKTLKALKGSIAKWTDILAGISEDEGPDNCPLCKMFRKENDKITCRGCPVARATGNNGCNGSPYEVWDDLPLDADGARKNDVARCELLFLKSLLPKRKARRRAT